MNVKALQRGFWLSFWSVVIYMIGARGIDSGPAPPSTDHQP
ncbi:MAG: hypothetical protein KatS3mg056_2986 [Chloroflexus sp.]|nr:MAG: hypothetical protein KatS3mg056_2986 [Chloroflexus sp.]